ncbi:MAG: tetratricopeptide repeat protein [Bacteroidales bacterium]|nr:tetratricopeptide repeat protein [Bacteroidales bacterium]
MKHLLLPLFLLLSLSLRAQSPEEAFLQANQCYQAGQYAEASQQYEALIANGHASAALYNNLGNAYYRQGEIALSLLNYERASRMAPHDSEIKENLAFVYSKTEDKIDALPQLFLVEWWQALTALTSLHGWVNIIAIVLLLTCVALVIFFLSRSYVWRKGSLLASMALGLLLICSVALGINASRLAHRTDQAIVTAPASVVKSSPDDKSVDLFVLHEGTKITTTDAVDQWLKIRIADGRKGWIEASSITTI